MAQRHKIGEPDLGQVDDNVLARELSGSERGVGKILGVGAQGVHPGSGVETNAEIEENHAASPLDRSCGDLSANHATE
ncbi:hypothetical protein GCM10027452_21440 [Micromonospora halotolerans]